MISKQEFVKYINFLKEIDSRELKFQKSLEECFGKENVGHFFAFNSTTPTIVEMLCKLLDIEPDLEDNFGLRATGWFFWLIAFGLKLAMLYFCYLQLFKGGITV